MGALTIRQRHQKWGLFEQGLKHCRKCDRILPLEAFGQNRPKTDGLESDCKECKQRRNIAYREKARNGETGEVKRRQEERCFLAQYKLKRCCKCKFIFPHEHFWKNAGTPDGFIPTCKDCFRTSRQLKGALECEFQVAEREELARLGKKRCSRCNEIKPISEFSYLHCTWDKKNVVCRPCSSEKQKIAYKKNPSLIGRGNQKRRAREAGVIATFTDEEWEFAKKFFDHRCCYCDQEVLLQREHFIPLEQGGPYSADNIIPACISCNSSKRNLLFDEWASGRGSTRVILGAREKIYEYLQLVAERR